MSAVADTMNTPARSGGSRLATFAIRLGALAMFVLIMLYFAVTAPGFLSAFNIVNVIEQSAILGVLAFGVAVVIIGGGSDVQTGGIDLSIAANAGLCAAVYALMTNAGYDQLLAVAATFATGMAIGCLNAFAVVWLRILPLLATLAAMNIAAGLELTITENTVVGTTSPLLTLLAGGRFLDISALAWVLILFALLSALVIHRTPVGVRLYAVGGHPEAARAAGLGTARYVAGTYIFSGFCAAFASILIVSRLSASTPGTGELLLSVLAAALLGTVFSRRFIPTIGGTLLAVIFIGFLANGFQLLSISSYWVSGVQGALILLVVAVTTFARPQEH
ncbi:ABC transporter permease [Mesorhizobium sp. VK9D]|uniref:ABC transporter permease n=1 Tax=Mesorhizobium australafricanum TaxID=3072311 RepID=UPI002A23BF20|nr:ABC transporter permease [Mesorhizobium sp. VK9D]MDX8452323.1 ABC transporter permease [Mesorhizobium sp. VK9D]